MRDMRLLAGTSGYSYKEWKGNFYPLDLPASRMLSYYADRFATVEINNTFYQMPSEKTLAKWADEVPAGFQFAFKAPGRITHQKRLQDAADPTAFLWRTVATLGARLGPVLFGLPPNLKRDVPRLVDFLALLPAGRRAAFEFRHDSWFADDVYDALRARGVALCIADAEELSTPFVATADWGYLRLRKPDYDDAALAEWGGRIAAAPWSDAYVYFKHEDEGVAPRLAGALTRLLAPPAPPGA
jgi:uncharacterized protein YecE (DUF72 family)